MSFSPVDSRVLIVEDSPANIQVLTAILRDTGYRVSVATNGQRALNTLTSVRPDLILLDVMMPEMDGFETCARIKASSDWRDIPIIFLTSKTETGDIVRGFELGAVDYIAKPFHAHELLARVNTHVAMDRLRRENERLIREEIEMARHRSVAQMVAGVAHEINTPLGIINTAAGLVTRWLSAPAITALAQTPEGKVLVDDLVDDEPDVLEVSRLAMRHFLVYGLPIRLHTATSKAEAIEVLDSLTLGRPDISMASVALIDVVMETDQAGLELCEYIRDVMKNRTLQIYVRTGQPGIAPERSVLDRYDIQGYLAKVEATEDKLYTLVKAGVREAYFTGLSHALQDLVHCLVPSAASRSKMADALREWERLARLSLKGGKAETIHAPICYIVDNAFITGLEDWHAGEVALRRREELAAMPSQTLNADGDRFTIDGRDLLIQIAPTAVNAAVHYMLRGTVAPPDWEVFLYHRYLRTFAALWKQAS